MCRVSTPEREMRQAPSARNTVSTTGNSSGSTAIASVSPDSRPSSQPPRVSADSSTTMAHSAAPSSANCRTKRVVSCCSGVDADTTPCKAPPIRPSCVRPPVAVTSTVPYPADTSAPENTNGRSSPPGANGPDSPSRAARLRTGTDSPVSSDSSTDRSLASSTRASAGTRSPSRNSTRSPGTTSRPAMRTCCPSRTTSARGLDRSRRASSARSLLRSW